MDIEEKVRILIIVLLCAIAQVAGADEQKKIANAQVQTSRRRFLQQISATAAASLLPCHWAASQAVARRIKFTDKSFLGRNLIPVELSSKKIKLNRHP